MRTLVALLSCFLVVGVSPQGSHDIAADLAALADPVATANARIRLLDLGRSDSHTFDLLSNRLPAMLLQAHDIRVLQSEAMLTGWLKIDAAIPSLIQLLSQRNLYGDGGLSGRRELQNDPIARALYEIGKPALPALKEALKSNDPVTRGRVEAILILTSTPETRAILKEHLAHESDGELRAYLRANGIDSSR